MSSFLPGVLRRASTRMQRRRRLPRMRCLTWCRRRCSDGRTERRRRRRKAARAPQRRARSATYSDYRGRHKRDGRRRRKGKPTYDPVSQAKPSKGEQTGSHSQLHDTISPYTGGASAKTHQVARLGRGLTTQNSKYYQLREYRTNKRQSQRQKQAATLHTRREAGRHKNKAQPMINNNR